MALALGATEPVEQRQRDFHFPTADALREMSDLLPLPGHPEPHTYQWTPLEQLAIRAYAAECVAAAVAAARARCAMEVWYTMQRATADDADDMGLEGWLREAERAVRESPNVLLTGAVRRPVE